MRRTIQFIPAWYQNGKWSETEQFWYSRKLKTEFDDTVKQIQLFHRNSSTPYQITLLSYAPNFRHFLHRQGVFRAPYWSCFDAMCHIHRKKAAILSFHKLNWPEHVEFIYTPFVIIVNLHGKKYAQMEFGEDGNLIQIDMYKGDMITRKNIYDDRGFLSSTLLYKDGVPSHRDYLDENGKWRIREYEDTGKVEINPAFGTYYLKVPKIECDLSMEMIELDGRKLKKLQKKKEKELAKQARMAKKKGLDSISQEEAEIEYQELELSFSKPLYDSMEELIEEVFSAYILRQNENDVYCMAMHPLHYKMLERCLAGRKKIVSFFGSRFHLDEYPECESLLLAADFIVTDSKNNTDKVLTNTMASDKRIKDITPFDTRVDLGISQQLKVQNILVPVEGLREEAFEQVIVQLAMHLKENVYARVHLFTRQADYNIDAELLERTRAALSKNQYPIDWAVDQSGKQQLTIKLDQDEKREQQKFFVNQCVDELEVSKCLKLQRLIVDARPVPDLYLQIIAISLGIPQIDRMKTAYVVDGENGRVLKDLSQLKDALDYYLLGLANWNEAMVSAYELGQAFTTDKLVEKWEEVIKSIE